MAPTLREPRIRGGGSVTHGQMVLRLRQSPRQTVGRESLGGVRCLRREVNNQGADYVRWGQDSLNSVTKPASSPTASRAIRPARAVDEFRVRGWSRTASSAKGLRTPCSRGRPPFTARNSRRRPCRGPAHGTPRRATARGRLPASAVTTGASTEREVLSATQSRRPPRRQPSVGIWRPSRSRAAGRHLRRDLRRPPSWPRPRHRAWELVPKGEDARSS